MADFDWSRVASGAVSAATGGIFGLLQPFVTEALRDDPEPYEPAPQPRPFMPLTSRVQTPQIQQGAGGPAPMAPTPQMSQVPAPDDKRGSQLASIMGGLPPKPQIASPSPSFLRLGQRFA